MAYPCESRSDAEYRRQRAYEGVMVFIVALVAAVLVGTVLAAAISSSLGGISRSLGAAG